MLLLKRVPINKVVLYIKNVPFRTKFDSCKLLFGFSFPVIHVFITHLAHVGKLMAKKQDQRKNVESKKLSFEASTKNVSNELKQNGTHCQKMHAMFTFENLNHAKKLFDKSPFSCPFDSRVLLTDY